jgi:hypothetical protein
MECTPIPFPSIVFTFGLAIKSIEELGGVSVIMEEKDLKIIPMCRLKQIEIKRMKLNN